MYDRILARSVPSSQELKCRNQHIAIAIQAIHVQVKPWLFPCKLMAGLDMASAIPAELLGKSTFSYLEV